MIVVVYPNGYLESFANAYLDWSISIPVLYKSTNKVLEFPYFILWEFDGNQWKGYSVRKTNQIGIFIGAIQYFRHDLQLISPYAIESVEELRERLYIYLQ